MKVKADLKVSEDLAVNVLLFHSKSAVIANKDALNEIVKDELRR